MADVKPGPRQVTVETVVPPGFPLTFANHTVVQSGAHELVLCFFQVEIPTTIDPAEFARLNKVRGNCVAKIVLTPAHAVEVLAAIQAQIQARSGQAGNGPEKGKH